jgi:hypothetical protein
MAAVDIGHVPRELLDCHPFIAEHGSPSWFEPRVSLYDDPVHHAPMLAIVGHGVVLGRPIVPDGNSSRLPTKAYLMVGSIDHVEKQRNYAGCG